MITLHILIAVILTVVTTGVFASAIKRNKNTLMLRVMQGSLALTALSGTALVVTQGGLGRFCATMTVATLAVVLVARFYDQRVPSQV